MLKTITRGSCQSVLEARTAAELDTLERKVRIIWDGELRTAAKGERGGTSAHQADIRLAGRGVGLRAGQGAAALAPASVQRPRLQLLTLSKEG